MFGGDVLVFGKIAGHQAHQVIALALIIRPENHRSRLPLLGLWRFILRGELRQQVDVSNTVEIFQRVGNLYIRILAQNQADVRGLRLPMGVVHAA